MKNFFTKNVEEAARITGVVFRSRFGLWLLGGISFLESALPVPIFTDPFLVAYVLADKQRVWKGVVVTSVMSVLGGVAVYLMAAGLYSLLVSTGLFSSLFDEFAVVKSALQQGVFWYTLLGAFTPVPYTIVGMAAGFVEAHFLSFLAASIMGRTTRYVIVGWFTYKFGESALKIAQQRILLFSIIGVCIAAAYFLLH